MKFITSVEVGVVPVISPNLAAAPGCIVIPNFLPVVIVGIVVNIFSTDEAFSLHPLNMSLPLVNEPNEEVKLVKLVQPINISEPSVIAGISAVMIPIRDNP